MYALFFFFNDTATTEIYTLSLHDALPICPREQLEAERIDTITAGRIISIRSFGKAAFFVLSDGRRRVQVYARQDRKSTRLNSSHANISYAVFCLKKKNKTVMIICLLLEKI